MDSNKRSRKKSSKKSNKLIKNDMNVFSSDSDEDSQVSSTKFSGSTSTSSERDIILHAKSRLANSMSIDSDSDFDNESQTQQTYKASLMSKKKKQLSSASKCKVIVLTPQKDRQSQQKKSCSQSSSTAASVSKTNTNDTQVINPGKSPINVISIEKVKIDLNSGLKNKAEQNVQRKPRVVRKIFNDGPSTSSSSNKPRSTDTCTQTGSDCQESSSELVSSSSEEDTTPKDVEVQTEKNNEHTNKNTIITTNMNLKRPHNVATQTDIVLTIEDSSSDEAENETPKRKTVQIEVSPPKRLKTIDEECTTPKRDEQKNKLEATKVNLTTPCQGTSAKLSKTPKQYQSFSAKKPSSSVKNNCNRTPMKQLTIKELNFCTSRNSQSTNSTPNSTPIKSTPNASPVKSTPSTSPAKSDKSKKESRYTQETHNRVFETVNKMVCWVLENEYFRILFTKFETDLLKKLFSLPDRRLTILCLRLYTRQHKWYNLLNLCEELNLTYEGFNPKEFYSSLTSGFVYSDYSGEKIETLLDYLSLADIKGICGSFKIRVLSKKKDLINKLLEYANRQCTLTSLKRADQILRDHVSKKLGICIKLETKIKDLFYRIHLLYSLTNPDLETANDIYNLMYKIRNEVVKYPKVNIDSPQLFSDRQDFLKFADACVLRKEFYDTYTKKDIPSEHLLCVEAFKRLKDLLSTKEQLEFDKKKPMFLRRFSAAWVYCKVLSSGSQNLGKPYPDDVCKWLTEMLNQNVYCINNRGHWYSQLALVTKAHKKDITGEVQSIIDGLSDKYVKEVQKHDLSIRGSKIRKGKVCRLLHDELQCLLLPETEIPISRTIQANVVHNNEPGRKLQFVRTTSEGKVYGSVEETAINYYTTEDNYTHGIHCEGQLLDALFIILFWDILYSMHIPNTFITELQSRPLDLYSGEFYSNRSYKIKARLKNIRDDWSLDNICEFASKIYSANSLELKSIAGFDFVDEGTFHIFIKSIGQKLLAAILERFAKDFKQFHSGLPDLFLWNCNELKCCFVEVKSENDRLSTKQLLWINYLHKFGAKVEVCHVQHIGSSSTKKMNKRKQED